MNYPEHIPAEKFQFIQQDAQIHDLKFETEPVGYLKDAFRRFRKNKSSVIGGLVIIILILFAAVSRLSGEAEGLGAI